MKKLLFFITLFSITSSLFAEEIVDGICYKLSRRSSVAVVTSCSASYSGDIVIPSSIVVDDDIYTVTAIENDAFNRCSDLISVVLPNTIVSIGKDAFHNCKKLKSINFPNGLKIIMEDAFHNCESLTSIELPASLAKLGCDVFTGCANLSSVTMSNVRISVDSNPFADCPKLIIYVPVNTKAIFQDISALEDYRFSESAPKSTNEGAGLLAAGTSQNKNITFASTPTKPSTSIVTSPDDATKKTSAPKENVVTPISVIDTNIPINEANNVRTFAVIIGNENYQTVADVPFANNDAKVFAQYCQKTLGLPEHNIRLYTDVTYGKMLSALKDIKAISAAYKGDISVIFYYAGHGVPNESNKDAFLLPIDADGTETEVCMPLSRLYGELAGLNANNVYVFLDACFSGAKRGEGMIASARGVAIKTNPTEPKGNMVVLSAASGDETAYPYKEKGHGLFTYFLLKKLQETQGNVTLQELGSYISTNVSQQSIVVNRKSQTPSINAASSLGTDWFNWTLR